jgi:hypothetical protein
MSVASDQELDDELRYRLYELAELLLPGNETLPSADGAGAVTTLLDETLALRPDLRRQLEGLLGGWDPEQVEASDYLQDLYATRPREFDLVTATLLAAYLRNPSVRTWLNWHGAVGEAQPSEPSAGEALEELLRPVRDRGAIYRPTPPGNHPGLQPSAPTAQESTP